jgi:hypothetical protein
MKNRRVRAVEIKGVHIAEKEQLGMRSLCCSTLDLHYRQLTKRNSKNLKGYP